MEEKKGLDVLYGNTEKSAKEEVEILINEPSIIVELGPALKGLSREEAIIELEKGHREFDKELKAMDFLV